MMSRASLGAICKRAWNRLNPLVREADHDHVSNGLSKLLVLQLLLGGREQTVNGYNDWMAWVNLGSRGA
jgi:hypothetical protein